jgi:LysR family transcriptional regulator, hypochlorite-specific transcription factor HypT
VQPALANAVFLGFDARKASAMNLSWLDDFLALAASGNFSRAAEERHMTQPAFSRRIKALEEWLGADLFDRGSQPVRLTETGQWFRKVAQDLLAEVARVPGEARAIAEAGSVTLRFAATHALSFTFMPRWLRRFSS